MLSRGAAASPTGSQEPGGPFRSVLRWAQGAGPPYCRGGKSLCLGSARKGVWSWVKWSVSETIPGKAGVVTPAGM